MFYRKAPGDVGNAAAQLRRGYVALVADRYSAAAAGLKAARRAAGGNGDNFVKIVHGEKCTDSATAEQLLRGKYKINIIVTFRKVTRGCERGKERGTRRKTVRVNFFVRFTVFRIDRADIADRNAAAADLDIQVGNLCVL